MRKRKIAEDVTIVPQKLDGINYLNDVEDCSGSSSGESTIYCAMVDLKRTVNGSPAARGSRIKKIICLVERREDEILGDGCDYCAYGCDYCDEEEVNVSINLLSAVEVYASVKYGSTAEAVEEGEFDLLQRYFEEEFEEELD